MPGGGVLTFRTRPVAAGVELVVSDTGEGMDEATRARLFEPFFTTKRNVGTGLGLSMVHNTVTRWGGSIEVESASGVGTSITLMFPSTDVAAAPQKPAVEQARSARLLVVDDNLEICNMLSLLLGERHQVETASNGQQALDRMDLGSFDALLIDLGMPGKSGEQVAKEVRQVDPQVATVLITGWCLDAGDPRLEAFDFQLLKPFTDLEEVEGTVAQAIALRDRRAQDS
jgi:two-component system, cell cycle sensor histidine kinase and response regulator CckA